MPEPTPSARFGWWPYVTFGFVAAVVSAGTWWVLGIQERAALDAHFSELATIGGLKAEQIQDWRAERLGGARVLADWMRLMPAFDRWLAAPHEPSLQPSVRALLHTMRDRLGYDDAIVFGPDGSPLLNAATDHPDVGAPLADLVAQALAARDARVGPLYRCPVCGRIHVEVAAPLTGAGRVAGVLVLRSDPAQALYRRLRSWPSPSASAETLLVMRDGDRVLYLNDLRHRAGAALALRLPIDSPDLPAARAVLGQAGRWSGIDYRGRRVLADMRPVAGSPWFLVAKIDEEEALAEARHDGRLIAGIAALAVLLVGSLLALLARRQQQRAYRAIFQAQARDRWLSSMIEQSVNEVYVFDASTLAFVYVSQSTLSHLGYTLDEMRAMTPLDIKPLMTPEAFAELTEPVRSGRRETVEFETVHRRKDGSTYDVLIVLRQIEGPTGPQFLAMGLDITNRKRLEAQLQQAQRMEAVGQLAGGVAHDFNNLLSVITSYAAFGAEAVPGDPAIGDYFAEIAAAGQRAALLTRQLLAFSRKQVLQPEVLNLNAVVAGVETLLRRVIGEDVRLSVVLAGDLRNVKADRGQFEQVLMNLAVNARDAMPDGGALVIETANVDLDRSEPAGDDDPAPGPWVRLTVSDTGQGMDEETRRRIFEPFFTTKAVGKGTGLGLSMVYGIVTQSGGRVSVSSEPGRGAVFTVELPAATAPASPLRGLAPSAVARGEGTVLVVEDEPGVRRLVQRILEGAGYRVVVAADPDEALAVCDGVGGTISLLVTDVVMPTMSGRQLAERLLARRPSLAVLYMSGYTEDALGPHGVLDRDIAFIAKPFTAAQLTQKVRETLEAHLDRQA